MNRQKPSPATLRWAKRASKRSWLHRIGNATPVLVAVVAALFALFQASEARDQNINSEHQELIELVADIAQEPQTVDQAAATFKANSTASNAARSAAQLTELAESEEAANDINLLNGNGVTALEYYETGVGLQAGESDYQALQFLQTAATMKNSDPRTHANVLRAEAQIYYSLGPRFYLRAYRADASAMIVFNSGQDIPPVNQRNNVAFTELYDAYYQASLGISCTTADAEDRAANALITDHPAIKTVSMENQQDQTGTALTKAGCPAPSSS